ncbi:TIR domain-containing protein [Curtobacterium flaccumfaciens]|uniref:TIR domain-containing protein n=1 Tax=Curtobacterium flaccumfaciens TaxID=2035 RepID=UPI001E28EE6C|nr:TIR domain-containing protein [Curtobacterium allii]MCE0459634.1 nucleotide-binding protein [Curtobacterium allii]
MPSNVFQKVDRRYLVAALSQLLSHGGLDVYESGLGINSRALGAQSKDQRASIIVNHLFEEPDTDALVLDLLDHLFVEPSRAEHARDSNEFRVLESNVLTRRGVVLSDDGYGIDSASAQSAGTNASGSTDSKSAMIRPVTNLLGSALPRPQGNNKVFVVHGRDMRPVDVLETFLTFCGLQMMEWSEAVSLTGKPQPTTYEIVHAGITNAAAVIVIFSPDDLGRVADPWASSANDPDKTPSGQARQNVILEAGMAFGLAPDRTIFVQSAYTRPLSDIDGFNWVKLNGQWDSRADLIGRLQHACGRTLVHKPDLNHRTAGPFQVK